MPQRRLHALLTAPLVRPTLPPSGQPKVLGPSAGFRLADQDQRKGTHRCGRRGNRAAMGPRGPPYVLLALMVAGLAGVSVALPSVAAGGPTAGLVPVIRPVPGPRRRPRPRVHEGRRPLLVRQRDRWRMQRLHGCAADLGQRHPRAVHGHERNRPEVLRGRLQAFTPPKPAAFGGHRVTVSACYMDLPAVQCDQPGSIITKTYTIDPIPTMVLKPKSGSGDADFTATYDTNEASARSSAGAVLLGRRRPLGGRVPIDPGICSAIVLAANAPKPNGVGGHTVSARRPAIGPVCPIWRASAAYTVLAPPTPTPTAADGDADSPTPTARSHGDTDGDPSASRSRPRRPSPSIEPSLRAVALRRAEPVRIGRGPGGDEPTDATARHGRGGHDRRFERASRRQPVRLGDRDASSAVRTSDRSTRPSSPRTCS